MLKPELKSSCCENPSCQNEQDRSDQSVFVPISNAVTVDFNITVRVQPVQFSLLAHSKGMDCAGCASVLDAHVRKLHGVAHISTSASSGKSTISFDANVLDPDAIIQHINALTFKVNSPSSILPHAFHFSSLPDFQASLPPVGAKLLLRLRRIVHSASFIPYDEVCQFLMQQSGVTSACVMMENDQESAHRVEAVLEVAYDPGQVGMLSSFFLAFFFFLRFLLWFLFYFFFLFLIFSACSSHLCPYF